MSTRKGDPAAWKRWLGYLGGAFLGGVLLVAAWSKAIHPQAFVEEIGAQGLDFLLSARAVAFLALALEAGLGLALVLGLRRLWVLVPAALLVAFFVFLTGRTYYLVSHGLMDESAACGCFGNLVDRTPAQAFWQDLLLLVPPLLLAFVGRGRPAGAPLARMAVAALGMAAVLALAWKAPELPLDDLATRLKPGVEVSELCAGGGETRVCLNLVAPELEEGRHVVVLADLDDEAFGAAVEELNDYALAGGGPRLWVLADATMEERGAFFWRHGPAFEIREAPEVLLKPLYRRLPRSFVVEGGEVESTYDGLPPFDELTAAGGE